MKEDKHHHLFSLVSKRLQVNAVENCTPAFFLKHIQDGKKLSYLVLKRIKECFPERAPQIFLEYAKRNDMHGRKLNTLILSLSNAAEILKEQVKHHKDFELNYEAQLKIFELNDASEVFLEYAKQGYMLCYEAQLKIFEWPNVQNFLLEYLKLDYWLCDEAQLKIFELPKAQELLLKYTIFGRNLCDEAIEKAHQLGYAL